MKKRMYISVFPLEKKVIKQIKRITMAKEGPRELHSNPICRIRRQALLSQVRKQNQTRTVAYVTLYTFQPQLDAQQTGESNCTGKRFTNQFDPGSCAHKTRINFLRCSKMPDIERVNC
ncbi:hypothetical protein IscW_ISCW000109 [Ixodes scapularis]|uniref:Uncharacterized protein n=1 Tax=Ixodes scapularis TaxID=6945 RepID=B7P7E9_IXOSC|nr:hypothetical protein IscW_ISCW000109 [Ixodes scapularis]|eukprot:XP_002410079.1 hypothetical protein IscW_ISCW000109 [Ixodes scapularis]